MIMAARTRFAAAKAFCSFVALVFLMGVPSSAQQCSSRVFRCSGMLRSASLTISQNIMNATVVESQCNSQRSQISNCVDDAKQVCTTDEERTQLDSILGSFNQLCGAEAMCSHKVRSCQLIMSALANSNSTDPVEMVKKMCPIYSQVSACMDALDDDCKKQEVANTTSKMIAQHFRMCGGSGGSENCVGQLMECSSKMQEMTAGFGSMSDGGDAGDMFAQIKKACPAFLQAQSCFQGMSDSCKELPEVKNATQSFKQFGAICGSSGSGENCVGKMMECSSKMQEVAAGFGSMSDGGDAGDMLAQINKACPVFLQAQSCFQGMSDSCKEIPQMKNATQSFKQFGAICSGFGGGSGETQHCAKLSECSKLYTSISSNVSEQRGDATAVTNACNAQQKEFTDCVDAGRRECKDNDAHNQLNKMKVAFISLCAAGETQHCAKLSECSDLYSTISSDISKQRGDATAVTNACNVQRKEFTDCVDAGRRECKDNDVHSLLNKMKVAFIDECGADPTSGGERFVIHTMFWTLAAVASALHFFG